jgi:hypothetical protein
MSDAKLMFHRSHMLILNPIAMEVEEVRLYQVHNLLQVDQHRCLDEI